MLGDEDDETNPMTFLAALTAARAASLATGRGGAPTSEEWPWVAVFLLIFAVVGTLFLVTVGLTYVESALLAAAAPTLVLLDLPVGQIAPGLGLAVNTAGCIIPLVVTLKILTEQRVPWLQGLALVGLGIGAAYYTSHVVPDKGVLLHYRIPAAIIAVAGAALFHNRPALAGSAAFVAGTLGVIVGADLMHMPELAAVGGEGRVILGGAGLLDGIFLVAVFAAMMAASLATLVTSALRSQRLPRASRL